MEIRWVNRGLVVVTVGGRTLHVGGEALLNHDPDYVIYAESIRRWEDGTPIGDEEKAQVLEALIAEAAKRGWIFAIDQQ